MQEFNRKIICGMKEYGITYNQQVMKQVGDYLGFEIYELEKDILEMYLNEQNLTNNEIDGIVSMVLSGDDLKLRVVH